LLEGKTQLLFVGFWWQRIVSFMKQSHPFNEVMKNFYFTVPLAIRPLVFGMTASPGGEDTVDNTYKSLQKLMDALDSKIIIPTDNADELKSFTNPVSVHMIVSLSQSSSSLDLNMLA
jgi:ERCC4-related helicase